MSLSQEDYKRFCSVCTNRLFHSKTGMICRITGLHPHFSGNCPDFSDKPSEKSIIEKSFAEERQERIAARNQRASRYFILSSLLLFASLLAFIMAYVTGVSHFGIIGILKLLASIGIFARGNMIRKGHQP